METEYGLFVLSNCIQSTDRREERQKAILSVMIECHRLFYEWPIYLRADVIINERANKRKKKSEKRRKKEFLFRYLVNIGLVEHEEKLLREKAFSFGWMKWNYRYIFWIKRYIIALSVDIKACNYTYIPNYTEDWFIRNPCKLKSWILIRKTV